MAFDPETAGRNLAETLKRYRTGILLGSVVGLFTGGPAGLIMGGLFGYFGSRMLTGAVKAFHPQQALFRATFTVMGKVAKADGRVSENEIAFASALMNQMRLTGEKRQEAIDYFNAGKDPECDIGEVLKPLAVFLRNRANIRIFFVEVQLQAALADGEVSRPELEVIQEVCAHLQMTEQEVEMLVARMRAQQSFHQQGQHGFSGAQAAQMLDAAYKVLGVDSSASDSEVKKAYRRLMSQHHPDKLVAKGLPEEMVQMAKEKSQEIQAAYEQIRRARKAS